LVADCDQAMSEATTLPVTIKTRIGIDHEESYEFLAKFIDAVSERGCDHFILHARKAWLSGLSPKENREIPPLNYDRVFEIKQNYPHLSIALNGGVQTVAESAALLDKVDSVMLGRSIYHHPYQMSDVDIMLYGREQEKLSRFEVIMAMES